MTASETLNKAKWLWGEVLALQAKIEFSEPKVSLLSHAAQAKETLEEIIDELEALAEAEVSG